MDGGNWRGEAWPAPDARARQRLPRVEDLRAAEQGYDRDQVRAAFDSFYRHIAQLDTTLRALEAVDVFRDHAGELRKELRALKAAGWTQQPWPSYGRERVSPGLPESLPRFALEAVFLIVVAVVVAVAGFDRLSIVLVMALAWAIVGIVEWAASRERFARTRVPAPARPAAEAARPASLRVVPAQAGAAESWDAPVAPRELEPASDAVEPEDERTMIEASGEPEPEAQPETAPEVGAEEVAELQAEPASEPALEPAELEPAPVEEEEPAPAASAEDAASARWSWAADTALERARDRETDDRTAVPRRRFWWRRRRDDDGHRLDPVQPRHVRVLPPEPSFDEQFPVDPDAEADPWERDLDLSIEEPEGPLESDGDREREAALDRGERA